MTVLIIRRHGAPDLRVRVEDVRRDRRRRVARVMSRMGYPDWAVRVATGLTAKALRLALMESGAPAMWARAMADLIERELRSAA